jgi:hypothetical protein
MAVGLESPDAISDSVKPAGNVAAALTQTDPTNTSSALKNRSHAGIKRFSRKPDFEKRVAEKFVTEATEDL